jgi:hypothetical protein
MLARMSSEASEQFRKLSALGASKGGRARAASLTPAQRSRIARDAARARWDKTGGKTPRKTPRREYAAVTPEVKEWMDADPAVGEILARLCMHPERDAVVKGIEEMLT